MVKFTIFAGGYSSFIASYLFNTDTQSLSFVSQYQTGLNPSWLSTHPTNSNVLYSVNEFATGALQSFDISSTGALSNPLDTASSGGDSPAFAVPLSTGQVAIMNYNSGNGRIIPTTGRPETFDQSAGIISFPQPVGGVSHPHMALEHGNEVLVPDLGGDKIWRLVQDGSPGSWRIQGFIEQPKGSGPRHIAIHNDRLYTLHELSSTLTVQAVPPSPNGTSPLLDNVSILPSGLPAGSAMAAAEILIPETSSHFPVHYVYVSNRNTGVQDSRGDAIAIFEHVNAGTGSGESLRLVKHVFTGIDQIRGMEFSPVTQKGEQFLVAGGVAGGAGVVVYKRTDGGRDLVEVARNYNVPTRTSFVWSSLAA
ncbi:hypothetical protein HGRIS_014111 [Hohenbuehelia grisea]|uniref:Isomerase YbhE n=1 Tax=Hohenbuehelia grisea TaxID=104357 RepID=A0ABR3JSF4_9AGAR